MYTYKTLLISIIVGLCVGAFASGYYFYDKGYLASSAVCRNKLQEVGVNTTPLAELKSAGGKVVSDFANGEFVLSVQIPGDPLAQGDKGATNEQRTVLVDANTQIYTSKVEFDAETRRPVTKKVMVPADKLIAGKMVSVSSDTDILKNNKFVAREVVFFE